MPKGHVWVAGDNMSNSIDSRHYGPVPIAMIRGKATYDVSSVPKAPQAPQASSRKAPPCLAVKAHAEAWGQTDNGS